MNFLRSIGPAIIVAAVVCGPGSILAASKVGSQYGYVTWVVLLVGLLMIGATMVASRIGVGFKGTPCDELASRLGRPVALLLGVLIFLVCAGFQTSNNNAIKAVGDYFFGEGAGLWCAIGLSGFLVVAVFLAPDLYRPVEKAMKVLVFLMVLAFLASFIASRPSIGGMAGGLVPRMPEGGLNLAFAGLVATTFSLAGAFYQAYLVRDRGWGPAEVKNGTRDSVVGICVLGGITLIILSTAAATFHGKDGVALSGITDVARIFENVFGKAAKPIFGLGILAGALSSFFVNSMIGGQFLADGLGKGRTMGSRAARTATAAALICGVVGMLLNSKFAGAFGAVDLIVMAQAATILGSPFLALALIYLGTCRGMAEGTRPPPWALALVGVGFCVAVLLSIRTTMGLIDKFTS